MPIPDIHNMLYATGISGVSHWRRDDRQAGNLNRTATRTQRCATLSLVTLTSLLVVTACGSSSTDHGTAARYDSNGGNSASAPFDETCESQEPVLGYAMLGLSYAMENLRANLDNLTSLTSVHPSQFAFWGIPPGNGPMTRKFSKEQLDGLNASILAAKANWDQEQPSHGWTPGWLVAYGDAAAPNLCYSIVTEQSPDFVLPQDRK